MEVYAKKNNKKEKTLTVVIPTYNMEQYLAHCLDSVTHPNVSSKLEVWVVNDGSTDQSLAIAQTYEEKRPDIIRILDKKNGNYGSCVNEGLKKATGKYFRILDADDCFSTPDLVKFLEELEKYDTDMVVTQVIDRHYQNDVMVHEYQHTLNDEIKNHIYFTKHIHVKDFAPDGQFRMHSMTFKTQVLRDCGLHLIEGISYTDTLYFFQPFAWVKDFIVLDLHLYCYRIGREGQTTDPTHFVNKLTDISLVFARIFQLMDATSQSELLKENQKALIFNGLGFLLYILKEQPSLKRKDYECLKAIVHGIKKYRFSYSILHKWYFRIWLQTESSSLLNIALRLRKTFGRKKKK